MLDEGNLTTRGRLSKGDIDGGTETERAATAPRAAADVSVPAGR